METEKIICKEPLDILKRPSVKKKDLLPSLFDYSETDEEYAETLFEGHENEWNYDDEDNSH